MSREVEPSLRIRNVGFVLVPGFSMYALASALEPLRMANQLSEGPLYATQVLGIDGERVTASCGLGFATADIAHVEHLDLVIVCAGVNVRAHCEPHLLAYLRRLAGRGVALGAVCTGSYVLAKAGVLDGYRCTLHWENISSLQEALLFPDVEFTNELFVMDRDRFTCSGGIAPLDMMLNLVGRQHGADLAESIAEEFVHERIRNRGDPQRTPLKLKLGYSAPKVSEVVSLMESNLAEPLSPAELAAHAGVSRRQIERLFKRHLGCAPSRYYLTLRLEHARHLLLETSLPIADVAAASGFVSAPHFTRCYRDTYGHSPTHERRRELERLPAAAADAEAGKQPTAV